MKILVTSIPFSGMKIDAPISKEALNARLHEGSQDDGVVFDEAPVADITLIRTHGGVIIKGVISGICRQGCATCGDIVPHEVVALIDWILQTESDRAAPNDEIDDPGVIVYQGEHVDLEEYLQEALILRLSPFWHPPRDARERCSLCKRDCSERLWRSRDTTTDRKGGDTPTASSFGALLKGALREGKK